VIQTVPVATRSPDEQSDIRDFWGHVIVRGLTSTYRDEIGEATVATAARKPDTQGLNF
jgi:hypothetical protein